MSYRDRKTDENVYYGQKTRESFDYTYEGRISTGKILVVGTQGGGKTAMATRLASLSNPDIKFKEELGGTIETEYLRYSPSNSNMFSLLLPIGGQEKWTKLRKAYGETAEGMLVVLDSCTKEFWQSSLLQARTISPRIPFTNYPIGIVVNKRDLNETLRDQSRVIAQTITNGFEAAKRLGVTYYSRGHKIIKREIPPIETEEVPFSVGEQIIVNALEREFFTDLEPGNARKGTMKLPGLSLVNCRMFSRALAIAISKKKGADDMAVFSLLNDMRPTMLELDTEWTALQKKYPDAGSEPTIPVDLSQTEIEAGMLNHLLASSGDITDFILEVTEMEKETGWQIQGYVHESVFEERGLKRIAELTEDVMLSIQENEPAEKFTLLDPIEEIF